VYHTNSYAKSKKTKSCYCLLKCGNFGKIVSLSKQGEEINAVIKVYKTISFLKFCLDLFQHEIHMCELDCSEMINSLEADYCNSSMQFNISLDFLKMSHISVDDIAFRCAKYKILLKDIILAVFVPLLESLVNINSV
jgi:hypothetical protein